jgi:hypothetical protein
MNDPLLMGLIGVCGPVLTVAVTKILEVFQKTQEQKHQYEYAIQKSLFEKKIQVAELAVLQFTLMKSLLEMIRTNIDMMINMLTGRLPLINKDILLKAVEDMQPLYEKIKAEDISSGYLYFDIKEDLGDLSSVDAVSILTRFNTSLTPLKNNPSNLEHNKPMPTIIELLMMLSDWIKRMENDISDNLRIIKSDMSQYRQS